MINVDHLIVFGVLALLSSDAALIVFYAIIVIKVVVWVFLAVLGRLALALVPEIVSYCRICSYRWPLLCLCYLVFLALVPPLNVLC